MPRFTRTELEQSVAASTSYAEVLRHLKLCTTGGNQRTIKKYCEIWQVSTHHFLTQSERIKQTPKCNRPAFPLSQILVEHSTCNRTNLKRRLFKEGLKNAICEICGQDEWWHGKKMSLILDHKNGIRDDCRLNNLRIVCPNCNATLPTHCGRRARVNCLGCRELVPIGKKYCSHQCYISSRQNQPHPERRRVKRPPYKHLLKEVEKFGYLATGRKYGVSDNAIRKWIKIYEKYSAIK